VMGPQGPIGDQGPGGSLGGYGYIYNLTDANVDQGAAIVFGSNGPLLGVTHTVGTSPITVTSAGVYHVCFSVSGKQPNQFDIFINGVSSASGLYGSGAGSQQNTASTILTLSAGDVITIVNFGSNSAFIQLDNSAGGSNNNVTASVYIQRLA
jgi:hypothetical protein